MLNYVWPLALAVLSNTIYQICAKSVPGNMNPLAMLTIAYVVAAVTSLILFYVLGEGASLMGEYAKTNWSPFLLGVCIVGLEVGVVYAYKAGWQVSMLQIVMASALAVILLFVGYLLYKEALTWNKIAGIVVCLAGLGLINMK